MRCAFVVKLSADMVVQRLAVDPPHPGLQSPPFVGENYPAPPSVIVEGFPSHEALRFEAIEKPGQVVLGHQGPLFDFKRSKAPNAGTA